MQKIGLTEFWALTQPARIGQYGNTSPQGEMMACVGSQSCPKCVFVFLHLQMFAFRNASLNRNATLLQSTAWVNGQAHCSAVHWHFRDGRQSDEQTFIKLSAELDREQRVPAAEAMLHMTVPHTTSQPALLSQLLSVHSWKQTQWSCADLWCQYLTN